MIVGIHQPNYLPGQNYFAKIIRCDKFILLDTVQYTKNNWTNRNRIKTPQGAQWLTVPIIVKGRMGQIIKDVQINPRENWAKKHFKAIYMNYNKSPYFKKYSDFFEQVYSRNWENLSELNIFLITNICQFIGIKTPLIKASDLPPTDLSSTELLVKLVKEVGGDSYLSGPGGKKYMDINIFKKNSISLFYHHFSPPTYKQRYGDFIPNLSIIDLMFNEGDRVLEILKSSSCIEKSGLR